MGSRYIVAIVRSEVLIIGAGMQVDCASVVFAAQSEVSSFIKESCP